ncbi:UNVERIFIED_CONTAM: Solanesyl diphosphate synthase 2, chloroplastic [Sesamum calycinum]|uniref:Solanesyl diphosphate synthase 2, chloroplastic n=1 Tax=Sesamum calycinum TaxID=2727403 RepID=A0AAW2Q4A9_9LAMI
MMSMTCHNLEFGRTRLEFLACGCSSNASSERLSVRNCDKGVLRNVNRGCRARKFLYCRREIGRCRAFQTKTTEAFLNGVGAGPAAVLDLGKEPKSTSSLSDMFEVVAEDLLTLNKNLQSIVGAENPVLMSAAEQIFGAGGKRMRPALVFLVSRATAEIAGLKELTKEHRRLAEIIEMIHTASLIHDDVLDESDMRRGKETVHQLYGTRVAVLAGDFMFAQSSWYLANLENLEVIKLISQVTYQTPLQTSAMKHGISLDSRDIIHALMASSLFDCDIQLDEYLIKSYYKTASLIAASTKGAAIFSGVSSETSEQMYQYGKNLGLSFQVVDDILDFTQSAEQLGKPAGSDLAKGNLTAPVLFALEKEPKLRDIIESEFCEVGSLEQAIDIVKNSGGVEKARDLAQEKADRAVENLQRLPASSFRLALEQMVKVPDEASASADVINGSAVDSRRQSEVYGPSMLPTLNLTGDVLLVEKLSPLLGKVGPGDVVLVRSPQNPRKCITKRIVGVEGDTVTFLVDPAHSDRSHSLVDLWARELSSGIVAFGVEGKTWLLKYCEAFLNYYLLAPIVVFAYIKSRR